MPSTPFSPPMSCQRWRITSAGDSGVGAEVVAVAVGAASLGVACAEAVGEVDGVASLAAVLTDGEGDGEAEEESACVVGASVSANSADTAQVDAIDERFMKKSPGGQ